MTIDLQRAHALVDLLNNPFACVSEDVRELVSITTVLLADRARSQRVAAPQANPVNVEGPEHLAPRPAPGLAFDARGVLVPVEEAEPVVAAPEMSRVSRAMLLNVLWHHQGGSSAVGQPLRGLLGLGRFDHLSDEQLSEAKWIDALLSKAAKTRRDAPLERWRHVKTGGIYEIVTRAMNEADQSEVIVYRHVNTGVTWVRAADEFFDGRFVWIVGATA